MLIVPSQLPVPAKPGCVTMIVLAITSIVGGVHSPLSS